MVRYYGHYSNVSCCKRIKQYQDRLIPSILEPDGSSREHRKNWARLIHLRRIDPKNFKTAPLCCSKCSGKIKILSFIEDPEIIKKRLKHLDLWDVKHRPPPKAFMNDLSTAIPPDTACCGSFLLDSQGEFLYSPSPKKQVLINLSIVTIATMSYS